MNHAKLKSYIFGFLSSVILTLLAYSLVNLNLASGPQLTIGIMSLAFIQALVQLVFFLHLGREQSPKWNLAVFLSTASMIFLVIFASIWIMNSLNYRHAHPDDVTNYILEQEGIH